MIIILFICIGFILPAVERKIKRHTGIWYSCAAGLSVLSLAGLIWWREMPGYRLAMELFGRGELAAALFIWVMLAPVLPQGKRLTRAVYHVRGELAILAAFLTLPHNIYFGRTYFVRLVYSPRSLTGLTFTAALCSAVMLLLLLPLTVTSFKKVRKRMKAGAWKRLQRFSYVFYGLLYLHVMLVFYPHLNGNWLYTVKTVFYTVLFGSYGTLRVRKYLKLKKSGRHVIRSWSAGGVIVTAAASMFFAAVGITGRETGCEESEPEVEAAVLNTEEEREGFVWRDGVWQGEGKGYLGNITVEVTVAQGKIEDIKIVSNSDDPDYFSGAAAVITKKIMGQQNTEVDTVSGATYSSQGILEAVENALAAAAGSSGLN